MKCEETWYCGICCRGSFSFFLFDESDAECESAANISDVCLN